MVTMTDAWTFLYRDVFRENEFLFFLIGTSFFTSIVYYGLCGFLMHVDRKQTPKWMLKYKVQPGVNQPVDREKLRHAQKVANFNQLFVSVPFVILLYPMQKYMGCSCRPEDLPSVFTFFRDLAMFVIIEEIGFFYMHRLAHWGPLYRNIHKQHHEWTAPVGIVAVYCHPLEHIFCNLMPFTLSAVIMGSHLITIIFWSTVALFTTIIHHSGYHLPLLPSPEFHDYHHLKFNQNYGLLGVLDKLHGTSEKFLKTPLAKRHQVLYGLRPMTTLFPDIKKQSGNAG